MASTTRYTVLLDEDANQAIERLRVAYKLKSKADVYDLAVRVLTWMTDQKASDYDTGRFVDGSFQPLLLPYEINKTAWEASKPGSRLTPVGA